MQNRVTPFGDVVAIPLRGAWMGNRGILHEGTEIRRFHASKLWIICALEYKGWRAAQWQPGHYTVLFFHDEAVALAAGHRPCALCRRDAYDAYGDAWVAAGVTGTRPRAIELDRQLHAERLVPYTRRRRLHGVQWADVPTGAFVALDGSPALVLDDAVVPWSYGGYGAWQARPRQGVAAAITPPSSMAALRAGYPVQIAPAAFQAHPHPDPDPFRARKATKDGVVGA